MPDLEPIPGFRLEIRRICCSFVPMHRLLMLLLVLGAFAGLGERVLAQVGIHGPEIVLTDDCCHDHGDHHSQDEDHHGPDCPPGPHHHHARSCCAGTMAIEEPEACRLRVTAGVRTGWHHPDEETPDGPVLRMDKPPLI
jgi:hypothetical protein